MTRSRQVWVVAGLGVALLFLWFSLRGIDASAVRVVLSQARPVPAIMAAVCSVLFMFVKAFRWGIIIADPQRAPVRVLHGPVWSGTAVNLMISHLGEFYRVGMLRSRSGIPATSLFASIGVERLFDFLALLTMLAFLAMGYVAQREQVPEILVTAAAIIATFVLVIGMGILLLLLKPDIARACVRRLIVHFPATLRQAATRWLEQGANALKPLASVRRVATVTALSMLQWGCIAAGIWFCNSGVGVNAGMMACLEVLILITVGTTLPTAPAYLGTTQIGFTTGLGLVGVPAPAAFAASLIYTVAVILPPMVVGSLVLLRRGMAVP